MNAQFLPLLPVLLALVLGSPLARAQAPETARPPAWKTEARPAREAPPERVHHAVGADSAQLARGATYKARFDARGATYAPFLGSNAPRNYPLTFRLEGIWRGVEALAFDAAALPSRAEDAVVFDRGAVVERYELRLDSMEQVLVFAEVPGDGDLVVRYAVEGDLPFLGTDGSLAFGNDLGGVRYGAATAFDGAGESVACETAVDGGAIEIRVPAAFLARAAMPLVIDPIVSSFAIDDSGADRFSPDVAYDINNQRYLVTYEQAFSASDHDVLVEMRTSAGVFVDDAYLDMSLDEYWANPKAACNRYYLNYLIVAEVGLPTGGARVIRGRFVFTDLGLGGVIVVGSGITITENAQTGEKINPDVGCDPRYDPDTHYVIVWERIFNANDRDIHARSIRGDFGAFSGVLYIDDSAGTFDRNPSISESCGFDGRHHIVWERKIDTTNSDLYAAELAWDGFMTIPSTPLVTGIAETEHAGVASIQDLGGNWLVAYERSVAGSTDHDIVASLVNGVTVLDTANVSDLEATAGSGTLDEEQVSPDADCDGAGFAVVYAESFLGSATDYDIYEATLTPVAGKIHLTEGHRGLAYHNTHENHPRIASIHSSGASPGRAMMVWDDEAGPGNRDVDAALFDLEDFTPFCFPGVDAVACPCGNPPAGPYRGCQNSSGTGGAMLFQNGTASLAADTVVFVTAGQRPTALSILMQGNGTANNAFGQGVRCVGGLLKRMYTKSASAGSITAPGPGDLTVSARSAALGVPIFAAYTFTYLVYYRDPNVLGGCPAASGFNATHSGAITWRP